LIPATLATWLNYATTLLFQILFAARFGTSLEAGAIVIAFSVSVSVAGVFITTATTLVMPRMTTPDGALSNRALRALSICGIVILVVATITAVAGLVAADTTGGLLRMSASDAQTVLLLSAGLIAVLGMSGIVGTIALSRGRRAVPAGAHAFPSSAAAVYLALEGSPTVEALLGALLIGAVIQLGVVAFAAWLPRPRIAAAGDGEFGSQAILMVAALVALSFVPPIQRVFAGSIDAVGVARLDYAARSLVAAQQLLIGGLLIAILPDWSRQSRETTRFRSNVGATITVASIGVATAGAIALVAAPELTKLVFERGAFGEADTQGVALLVRLMAIGFVAESISLVLVQALYAAHRASFAIGLGLGRVALQMGLTAALGLTLGATGVAVAYTVTMILLAVTMLGGSLGTVASLPSSAAGFASAILAITGAGVVGMFAAGTLGAVTGVALVIVVSLACAALIRVPELVTMLRRQAAAGA
jgi:peptidoglycan biosynthesis protein MviN/MurJ (putative lipid II flippase)